MIRWTLVLALLALPWPAAAQEYVLDSYAGAGARAMGMGGAFTALSDDFVGLFWNPAGLARTTRGQTVLEFGNSRVTNDTRFYGSPARIQITRTPLGVAGLTVPFPVVRGSFVLGAGWARTEQVDAALRIEGYDEAAGFDKAGFSEDQGAVGAFTLGAAVDVAPNVAVGAAVMRWTGESRFRQELTERDPRDVHPDLVSRYARYGSDDDLSAWGLRAGVHYRHASGLLFGMSMRAPMTFRIDSRLEDEFEDVTVDGTETLPVARYTDTYALRVPMEFSIGIAFRRRGLTLSADVVTFDPRQARYTDEPAAVEPNVADFRAEYRNSVRTHVGAEYRLPSMPIVARGGYYRDPIRYLGGTGQPAIVVERDRSVWSAGIGTVLEQTVSIDATVTLAAYRSREGSREDDVKRMTARLSVSYAWDAP